jgi:hypothetical protein
MEQRKVFLNVLCWGHGTYINQELILIFKYAVWGSDPVYTTINYAHDPDEVIDYRGPEFHEPTPEVVTFLMEVWDSISAELIFLLCAI